MTRSLENEYVIFLLCFVVIINQPSEVVEETRTERSKVSCSCQPRPQSLSAARVLPGTHGTGSARKLVLAYVDRIILPSGNCSTLRNISSLRSQSDLSFKPVFHLIIFSREANFSFVFGLSTGTIWN